MASRDTVGGFLIGAAAGGLLAWALSKRDKFRYPPIRIKGGSIEVAGQLAWEFDPDEFEGDNENNALRAWIYGSRIDSFEVRVRNNMTDVFANTGTRLVVHVAEPDSSEGFRLVLKPNGQVRILDKKKKLARDASDPTLLKFGENSFIKRVVLRENGQVKESATFGSSDRPVITIR